ncbi:phosphatase PAP2 family protein [bacterium]|nr:phosphatase PAP2 family protein [bacterium]
MKLCHHILFWQPKGKPLAFFSKNKFTQILLIILNYSIWLIMFYISWLLIKFDPNNFLKILIAIIIGEAIERFLKQKFLWPRPMFQKGLKTPPGLVKGWYKTGSFPSGHTIKSTLFFLLILQFPVFNPLLYLFLVIPLLIFRVIVGFHYPVDIFGGLLIGISLWLIASPVNSPLFLNNIILFFTKFI